MELSGRFGRDVALIVLGQEGKTWPTGTSNFAEHFRRELMRSGARAPWYPIETDTLS
jgi:hypothetical protein